MTQTKSRTDADGISAAVENAGSVSTNIVVQIHSNGKPQAVDVSEIIHALDILAEPGQVVELRALDVMESNYRPSHTVSGYFNDWNVLAKAVQAVAPFATGTYITLNAVNPELLARAVNRARVVGKGDQSTSDRDIVRRRWLLVDSDPLRPAGISSTDDEHNGALARAGQIRDFLLAIGWPEPVVADSANGAHLLYRIDLPSDDSGLVKQVLAAISFRFDDEHVHIDQSVFNPGRIVKLYGTTPHKGDHTSARPHRMARLVSVPSPIVTVTVQQLEAMALLVPPPPMQLAKNGPANGVSFDLDCWIAGSGLEVIGPSDWQGGRRWILPVCPWNSSHTNRAAYIVQLHSGAIAAGCHHEGCHGKDWHALRDLVEPGWRRDEPAPSLVASVRPTGGDQRFSHNSIDSESKPELQMADTAWPGPLDEAALHGLAGEIVRAIAPNTEADPAALLMNFLVAAGNAIGRGPHASVGATRHFANLYAVLVGETAKGRKGTSWDPIREFFALADPVWAESHVASGLSSGEGVIWAVRDPVEKAVPIKVNGKATGEYGREVADQGISDKRLLVVEGEYASVLKVMAREGNTLSPILRLAWDSGNLRSLVKNSPAQASGAHISILGHVTRLELLRHMTDTEQANGFGNRFLWVCARRTQILPEGGGEPPFAALVPRLQTVLMEARKIGQIQRDEEARRAWAAVYPALSEGRPGLFGAVIARAEAQVLRLSMLYALLDGSSVVRGTHLMAAIAVWEYCEASAEYIFGQALGDPIADRLLDALASAPAGLTRTAINRLFGSHVPSAQVAAALAMLEREGRIIHEYRETGGRDAEVWRLA